MSHLVQEAELVLGFGIQYLHLKENNSLFSFFSRFAFDGAWSQHRGHHRPIIQSFPASGLKR